MHHSLIFGLFVLWITAGAHHKIQAQEQGFALASLSEVKGYVEVTSPATRKLRQGREGLILYGGEQITTGRNGKATIVFRDGTRFRLFRSSDFLIKEGIELPTRDRTFRHQLYLKRGTILGRIKRGSRGTRLRTPTAVVGIKGTTFRFTETENGEATVGVSEGVIEVFNTVSRVLLGVGELIKEFNSIDKLIDKVTELPNLLYLGTETKDLDFSEGQAKQLFISIQMIESRSHRINKRSGPVLLESDYQNMYMPLQVQLNSEGFIRFPVLIEPPQKKDRHFEGLISIYANMDEVGFDDVGQGMIVLRVTKPGRKRTLFIDPGKDQIDLR